MARRLGPAVITMIVVDVVLVAVLIALMVTAPRPVDDAGGTAEPSASSPSANPDAPEGAEPTTSSTPAVTVPDGALELAEFVSPSGNIWCTIADDVASCQIADRAYEVDAVEGCDDDAHGQVVQVGPDGASFPCPAGEIAGPAPDEREQLAYGDVSVVGDVMCTSSEAGMRCEDVQTGSGFSLARAEAATF